MNNEINEIKNIHKSLDMVGNRIKAIELSMGIDEIEGKIIEMVRSEVLKYFGKNQEDLFLEINKVIYDVTVSHDVINNHNLLIAIINPVNVNEKKTISDVVLDNMYMGQYQSLTIIVPNSILQKSALLIERLKWFYEVCYSWLNDFLNNIISDFESELSNNLYTFIQRTFEALHKRDLIRDVWLVIVDTENRTGSHLLGGDKKSEAMKLFSSNNNSIYSSAQLLINFYAGRIDYDKMFSQVVIKERKPIDFILKDAKYQKDENILYSSEGIAFESGEFTLYPIVHEGKYYLIAGFGTKEKEAIIEILSECENELFEILKTSLSGINSISLFIQNKYNSVSKSKKFWENMGYFMGGLYSSISPPK
jgi:hypothetical protein